MYYTFLVARSLDTGAVVWAQNMTSATGPSKLPVSPPIINVGVVSLVTAQGLLVLDSGSGQMRYMIAEGEQGSRRGDAAWQPPADTHQARERGSGEGAGAAWRAFGSTPHRMSSKS